jgi:hypothetical protein
MPLFYIYCEGMEYDMQVENGATYSSETTL